MPEVCVKIALRLESNLTAHFQLPRSMLVPEIIVGSDTLVVEVLSQKTETSAFLFIAVRPVMLTGTNSRGTAGARYVIGQAGANYSTGVHSACVLK